MQHKRFIQIPGHLTIGDLTAEHVQEISGMVQIRQRCNRLLAVANPIPGRDNGSEFGNQTGCHAQDSFLGLILYIRVMIGQHRNDGL